MTQSNRYINNFKAINREMIYSLDEAIKIVKSFSPVKFDETIDLSVNLGVDPRHADQIVRGTVSMPNGTGKDLSLIHI